MSERLPPSTGASELLSTKLALPRPRRSLVTRESLFSLLDSGADQAIILLSAPAGFGKTTLASTWIASRYAHQEDNKVAWLSLDLSDNDPVRFWRYVIGACQQFDASIGCTSLMQFNDAHLLNFDFSSCYTFEPILTRFINDLNRHNDPCVLVLENYHSIGLPLIHETFAYFLEHLPSTLRVLLLSRSDLPLPLVPLRTEGHIFEIGSSDLRFSLEETRLFFQQALAFPLSEEMIRSVHDRIEGWCAGLNILAAALHRYTSPPEVEHFVKTLTGRYRPLLESLVADVLNTQPESLQLFLLQTCGLPHLTGSLCDAVTGWQDGERMLEQVEQANLFLELLDGSGQWYRYHPLFAEAMQHEAQRRLGTDALKVSFQRASCWFEQNNRLTDAIEATLRANDFTRAAALIERLIGSGMQSYALEAKEFFTLRRWFDQMPQVILQDFATLNLLQIIILLFDPSGRILTDSEQARRIEELLATAERRWQAAEDANQLGVLYTLRALLHTWQGNFRQAGNLSRQALGYLREEEAIWRSECMGIMGTEEHLTGSLDVARRMIQESIELNRRANGNPYGDRALRLALGEVYIEQGELRLATENFRQILAEADVDLFDRGKALLGLARLAYEWNMLDIAEEEARNALEAGQILGDMEIQVQAGLVLARVQHARGEAEQAKQQIAWLVAQARTHPGPQLHRELLLWQARHHLLNGDHTIAQEWMEQRPQVNAAVPLRTLIQEDMLHARLSMVFGDFQEAQRLLEECLSRASQYARTAQVIEILTLLAQIHYRQNNVHEASQIVETVLLQARAKGYQRLFLDEGETMHALLNAFEHNSPDSAIVTSPRSSALEPLSKQEQRVLRLFVAGLSKPQIAAELVVSTNTIKTHLRRIYQKLNVTSRAEVREVVRRNHLL